MKTAIVGVSIATVVTAFGAVGTANAATPASPGQAPVAEQPPPPVPPHDKFRYRFRTLPECQRQGEHDFPGRPREWECRPGPDPVLRWELWSH